MDKSIHSQLALACICIWFYDISLNVTNNCLSQGNPVSIAVKFVSNTILFPKGNLSFTSMVEMRKVAGPLHCCLFQLGTLQQCTRTKPSGPN